MKGKRRLTGLVFVVLISILISGCWDRRELQDRNFVLAVAIDVADAGKKPGQSQAGLQTKTFVQPHGDKQYRLSLQILRLGQAGGGEDSQQAGGKTGPRTYVMSNTGQSLFEMVRDMLGQSSKSLYFEHIQAIVISEAAVRQAGLKPILDWFLRDAEMRWRIKVFVTPGEARPIIEYAPPSKEAGGIYLANILRNHLKNVHVAGARTDLGNISVMLENKQDMGIPCLEMTDNIVKARGVALFKKDKFVGYADEQAVAGIKYIRGTEKSAVITVPGDNPGEVVTYELFSHDTQLEPHVDGEHIYFTLDITMRGNLGEYQARNQVKGAGDPAFIQRIEVKTAEEVKRIVLYGKDTCQSMGVDILTFSSKLKTDYPKTWAKIKDHWGEIFPNVPLVVSVNVVINQLGEHK
ncbi:Ger(x)C family spore germination protein [Sporomusa acidovorans]|uniref:Spore germination protein B3 n=1 Tax=Sporomusa acidovorans (strain ATCC 49682 / DSM 3132 / Mol) TaxID=1123286 RepID=A0ABZ3IWX1_SPOA4|nr:Ger(x)C family spore germination protein [Sporomusa acidovorans]OZC23679.1 spore germination protein B3 precursor [Sporomusa acidovorans DSM 3132]SDE24940.1 germination protein, Ger(x)C family [Sporomusa acidovorans]